MDWLCIQVNLRPEAPSSSSSSRKLNDSWNCGQSSPLINAVRFRFTSWRLFPLMYCASFGIVYIRTLV